jgi:epoxyqueuosine reductase
LTVPDSSLAEREHLEAIARGQGAVLFGVADLQGVDLEGISAAASDVSIAGLRTGVSFGCRLSDVVVDSVVDHPTRTYQYHYRQVNLLLDHIGLLMASRLQAPGHRVFPVPSSQIVDWTAYRGHISHKAVARLAGLGWIGRSNLLVNPVHGARVRYATVLTDMVLPYDKPTDGDCDVCRRCVAACPGQAIGEEVGDFDLQQCVRTIDQVRRTENIGSRICGICVRVCGGNRGAYGRQTIL